MSVTLDKVTMLFNYWLSRHDLPREGVRLIVEFPNHEAAFRAEQCIAQELRPHQMTLEAARPFGVVETMNGLGLTLTYRQPERHVNMTARRLDPAGHPD
jgi:hypothetical protein